MPNTTATPTTVEFLADVRHHFADSIDQVVLSSANEPTLGRTAARRYLMSKHAAQP